MRIQENPFKERICKVFSHDGTGNMTFDDFLDMLSVFSEQASRDTKLYYAFKIYGRLRGFIWRHQVYLAVCSSSDFNDDQLIGVEDIEQVVTALTRGELSQEEIAIVCDKVFEEADIDDDKFISFSEFQHVISRAPEFLK